MQYLQKLQVKTLADAIKAPSGNLATIRKQTSEPVLRAIIVKIITDIASFFSVGKGMNDMQIADTAKLIAQEFYFLKPEDFKLFGDRLKLGKYGKAFDRMDGNVILIALQEYCNERINEAESISNELHKQLLALDAPEEKYFITIGKQYLRAETDAFDLVDVKETATRYAWGEAMNLKKYITGHYPDLQPVITFATKPDIGLIDYIKKTKPELVKELHKNSLSENGKKYQQRVKEILAMDISDFDKENKIREMSNLLPLTEEQFNERNKIAKG